MGMIFRLLSAVAAAVLMQFAIGSPAAAANDADPVAAAFGSYPYLMNARLSPDGSKLSFLHVADAGGGFPVAVIMDMNTAGQTAILSSKKDSFLITSCTWANNERLLCSFRGIDHDRGIPFSITRMVAVNADGSDQKVLMQDKLRDTFTQFQDEVVDYMPDDPEHILVELPDRRGTGVSRVNIYTGKMETQERVRENTREWVSDGRGAARLRFYVSKSKSKWYYRAAGDEDWELLRESKAVDGYDNYYPVGFGDDPNHLMVLKPHEGRLALWSVDLGNNLKETLVYAHQNVDVVGEARLGKYNRSVAATFYTEVSEMHYFDKDIERLYNRISAAMPEKSVWVISESWDRRYYLIHIGSDQDPGAYYRLDLQTNNLMHLAASHPQLSDRQLAVMAPVAYPARDGVEIPGYLTLPPDAEAGNLPLVVLPHGGPESRDVWDYDWLGQFFAAKGYAVLQPNFRGSGGYGEDWASGGAYREWRQAVSDISDGARWLVSEEIVDPARICVVGWSYGGYAALMSAIEEPELYQCAVSIAGVTDPLTLIRDANRYASGAARQRERVGTDDEVIEHGSPMKRASEIQVPVLLFHGDDDMNVAVKHSKQMHKALRKAKKSTELILYEDVEHSIEREEYRIDMLGRIGGFLQENIGE